MRSRRASQRTARPFETPGATNSRKRGWEIVTSARPAKCARAIGAASLGCGWLPDREHLRDRMRDRLEQVGDELGPRAHERRVVVGPWVVGTEDEALEVVDVRVEPVIARPLR